MSGKDGEKAWPSGAEESCLCYVLYLVVRNMLCGDPLATMRSKVGSVNCGANDGCFFITWTVKGNGSAVRKSLGMAIKSLNPGKLFADYSRCVRDAGGKPKREHFNHVAHELAQSLKDQITCGVVGTIRLEKDKLEDIVETVAKKVQVAAVAGSKQKPNEHVECDHGEMTEVKIDGWQAFVAREYINAKVKGISSMLGNKQLILSAKPKQWDVIVPKLKRLVKDYVKAKYARVGDELQALLGYKSIASADICSMDVRDMIKNKITSSEVEKAINSAL
jgi:hypothetical protein